MRGYIDSRPEENACFRLVSRAPPRWLCREREREHRTPPRRRFLFMRLLHTRTHTHVRKSRVGRKNVSPSSTSTFFFRYLYVSRELFGPEPDSTPTINQSPTREGGAIPTPFFPQICPRVLNAPISALLYGFSIGTSRPIESSSRPLIKDFRISFGFRRRPNTNFFLARQKRESKRDKTSSLLCCSRRKGSSAALCSERVQGLSMTHRVVFRKKREAAV